MWRYSAPNLLGKISDILLRFKLNYNDIQQAFLNIEIFPELLDFSGGFLYDFCNTDAEKIVLLRF